METKTVEVQEDQVADQSDSETLEFLTDEELQSVSGGMAVGPIICW